MFGADHVADVPPFNDHGAIPIGLVEDVGKPLPRLRDGIPFHECTLYMK